MDIEKRIIVRPTDTDSYNIVHHPQYFVWVEEAILECLISSYGSPEKLSYEINKFNCKFISPGLLYDELILRLIPKNRKSSETEETLNFRAKIIKAGSKATVIEADFFVNIRGTANG